MASHPTSTRAPTQIFSPVAKFGQQSHNNGLQGLSKNNSRERSGVLQQTNARPLSATQKRPLDQNTSNSGLRQLLQNNFN